MKSKSGKEFPDLLLDDEDIPLFEKYCWQLKKDKNTTYLNATVAVGPKGKKKWLTQGIHRVILGLKPGDGKIVDHINGNGMDNRKANLRVCTVGQNRANSLGSSKTGFRGVYKNVRKLKDKIQTTYIASIKIDGKLSFLGKYKDPVEAAFAYDQAARKHHGAFAKQNQIDEICPSCERHTSLPVSPEYDALVEEMIKTIICRVNYVIGEKPSPCKCDACIVLSKLEAYRAKEKSE